MLLVWPYTNSAQNTSYDALHAAEGKCGQEPPPQDCEAQTGIHIGGMVWYGNYLYVADTTKGLRVFDMRHILDLNPDHDAATNDPTPGGLTSNVQDKTKVGRHSNVWYSYGYRYVMPQVASWHTTAAKNTSGYCFGSGKPKISFLSLDRTGSDHLVTGEYCNLNDGKTSGGRVATWPLNGTTGEPVWYDEPDGFKVYADAAYALPTGGELSDKPGEPLWHKIQGAARNNGNWYFHRSNGFDYGRMLRATVSSGQLVMKGTQQVKSSTGPEDLYVEHGRTTGRTPLIWSISEHRYVNDTDPTTCSVSTAMCKRVLYGYKVSDIDAKP